MNIKHLVSIALLLLLLSPSAAADCAFDAGDICDDTSGSNNKNTAIASIAVVTALAGVGIWYLFSDEDIEDVEVNPLASKHKGYRFSLAPLNDRRSHGVALEFSYQF